MHRFVPTYFSDRRPFKWVLNANVTIDVVVKVRILHKQGNNIQATEL